MAIRNRKPRRPARRARVAKRSGRKLRVPRGINRMSQHASIVESVPANPLSSQTLYGNIFALNQFPRAQQVAVNYRWYKAEYVEYEYTPFANVFSAESASTIPYMFSAMNRTQRADIPVDSANYERFMLSQGATPKKFTNKIVIRYKPNWCAAGLQAYTTSNVSGTTVVTSIAQVGQKQSYDWLPCPDSNGIPGSIYPSQTNYNNVPFGSVAGTLVNSVTYNGHQTLFLQASPVDPTEVADLVIRVKWVFKDAAPQWQTLREPAPAAAAVESVK